LKSFARPAQLGAHAKGAAVAKSPRNPKVDKVFKSAKTWRAEVEALREIVLSCGLTEELKWGQACYTLDGKNIVLIHGFKEYSALLFMKGALLKDPKDILIQQTRNVQSARQIRFTKVSEINKLAAALKGYIRNAIEVEKAGLSVVKKTTEEFETASEWLDTIDNDPDLKEAFDELTPGRQRGYLLFFAGAKQSKTRQARIDKSKKRIRAGKGLLDR
jgi:uncharacterized protein YdeI (YjbR/CyaY-like superfamily)